MSSADWDRLSELLDACRALPRDERRSFLDGACPDDPELVERLLALAEEPDDPRFLDPPTVRDRRTPGALFGGSLEGLELGSYRLTEEIGRGGEGVVYGARQPSLDRPVAVKVLPFLNQKREDSIERFRREARAASSLDHPHINPVYDYGESDGVLWYAMRRVEGHDLGRELALKSASPEGEDQILPSIDHPGYVRCVIQLVSDLADAVQYAHDHGVIHRDIKPQNILVDRSGHASLVDFGLARRTGETSLTRTDQIQGTLQYMSPEQARLLKSRIDHRTDIYSLSVVLYELLSLQRPFDARSPNEVLSRIASGTYVHLRKRNRRIPSDLALVCETGMAIRPKERYATAAALRADLQRVLQHEAVLAVPSSWQSRAARQIRRHRRIAAAILVLALVTLLSIGIRKEARANTIRSQVRGTLQAALSEEDWLANPGVVTAAQRSLSQAIAGSHVDPDSFELAISFRSRLDAHAIEVTTNLRQRFSARKTEPDSPERDRDLLEIVNVATQALILHPEDGWLQEHSKVRALFPTISFRFREAEGIHGPATAFRIDPSNLELSKRPVADFDPKLPIQLPPGDYRFVLRSRDGFAELERDCRSLARDLGFRVHIRGTEAVTGDMVRVGAGALPAMDSPPLGCIAHPVGIEIPSFFIDLAEVSNGEYLEFLRALAEEGRTAELDLRIPPFWDAAGFRDLDWTTLPQVDGPGRWHDRPALGVDWESARAYAEWRGKRLPTHLELELAIRGSDFQRFPWGATTERRGIRANDQHPSPPPTETWRQRYRETLSWTLPVREPGFRHPPHMLYHAYGNASEWTSSPPTTYENGVRFSDDSSRLHMGGPWYAGRRNTMASLADHYTAEVGRSHASHTIGFRCAKSQGPD